MDKAKLYLDSPPDGVALGLPISAPAQGPASHLVTFHSGYPYSLAAERLRHQATATKWFTTVEIYYPQCPHPAIQEFVEKYQDFVHRNPRGYGCWRWKPLLIQSILASLPEGDHLYYMDAGCEVSALGSARFAALDQELARRGVLGFEINIQELGWSKREAVEAVLGHWDDAIMASRQIQATWFGLCNIAPVREMVAEWAAWATHGEIITDSLNPEHQHPLFKGHRHDQSLWSLVLKKRGIEPLPQEDCFKKWLYVRDSWVLLAPVHGLRSRGARSRVDRIAPWSSKSSCVRNLNAPAIQFRLRIALSRIKSIGLGLVSRLRAKLKILSGQIIPHQRGIDQ